MRFFALVALLLGSSLMRGNSLFADEKYTHPPAPLQTKISDFTLTQPQDGKPWAFVERTQSCKAIVVWFTGTECPVCNLYAPVMERMAKEFSSKGVIFVGINSNIQDTNEMVSKHAKENGFSFSILKDSQGQIAEKFQAKRIPEVFVLDANRIVRYRGRIDDQFERSVKRLTPTKTELRDALRSILDGKPVANPFTTVVGCPIGKERPLSTTATTSQTVTYCNEVARILQNHCQECHRPGEIGPFALMNYKDARNWSEAIREVVTEGIMPPWHADPKHGSFQNDRRLSDADKKNLLTWIDQGCPEGNPVELPAPRSYNTEWSIGKPDVIFQMSKPFNVPAQAPKSGVPYQYFSISSPFEEDKWVTSVEVHPGDRAVVHHVIVYILEPGMKLPNELGLKDLLGEFLKDPKKEEPHKEPRWLGAYVPGDKAVVLPKGMARRIGKGCRLGLELHYTPNGKETTDRTSVGLIYAKEAPKKEVFGDMAVNDRLAIPPHAENHPVTAKFTLDLDVQLISMNPHMHLRGKSFEYKLTTPNGKEEILLSVPKYDFNWQTTYVLKEPRTILKGSTITCVAHYDNSAKNPNNPDPSKKIKWGEQTWDEMMLGYFEYFVK